MEINVIVYIWNFFYYLCTISIDEIYLQYLILENYTNMIFKEITFCRRNVKNDFYKRFLLGFLLLNSNRDADVSYSIIKEKNQLFKFVIFFF